jgi:hypothetical protein
MSININATKLLRRKEITERWITQCEQNIEFANAYCCPKCRDILTIKDDGIFVCENESCLINTIYFKNK